MYIYIHIEIYIYYNFDFTFSTRHEFHTVERSKLILLLPNLAERIIVFTE